MLRFPLFMLVAASAFATPANAQKKPTSRSAKTIATAKPTPVISIPAGPPSTDSLGAISRRGRLLMERDSVSWLGGDAMTALSFPPDSVRRLITRRSQQGWEVASGKLSADGNTFLINQLATPGMQRGKWATSQFDPPQSDTGYLARAARAIETSLGMFQRADHRPYIAMVVPAEDGPWWWVYLYPAPVQEGVWPRGGDMRFRVSADGRVITESRRLHDGISEYSVRTARSTTAGSDRKAVVSGNTPEDTDVFHVLQRRPALPELMTAGPYRYRIDIGGSIRLLPNN